MFEVKVLTNNFKNNFKIIKNDINWYVFPFKNEKMDIDIITCKYFFDEKNFIQCSFINDIEKYKPCHEVPLNQYCTCIFYFGTEEDAFYFKLKYG